MKGSETHYVVVTRSKPPLPISRHMFLRDAADKIVYEKMFDKWKVLAQDGRTASAPMRTLTHSEQAELERRLYPSLFQMGRDDTYKD